MEGNSFVTHVKAYRWVTFMVLLFVLGVGITIGTLVSTQVGAERAAAEQLKITNSGKPLNTDAPATLSEGFADVAERVGPAVVNINTESIVRNNVRGRRGQGPQVLGAAKQMYRGVVEAVHARPTT